jgi:hypothetical protein
MRWWCLLVMVTSCVDSNIVTCMDGRVCPAGTACDDVHGTCVTPRQLLSCADKQRGDACDIAAADDGICDLGVCIIAGCGDGYRRGDEACDGDDIPADVTCPSRGFYDPGDVKCNDACGIDDSMCTGFCGDHLVNPVEEVCEMDVAPVLSCVDFGYGAGVLGCNLCAPGLDDCRRFGWDSSPLPFAATDIHGTADTNVFVIGGDAVAHFDGVTWKKLDLGGCAGATLNDVWAIGDRDAFVAGTAGSVLHVTSTGCTKLTAPSSADVYSVWASSAIDVYAITFEAVWHYNGATWTSSLSGAYNGVWGASANDVFVVDGTNNVFRNNTGSWSSPVAVANIASSGTIWGTSATEVYVSGRDTSNRAYVARFDGNTWSPHLTDGARLGGSTSMAVAGASGAGTVIATGFAISIDTVPFVVMGDATGWTNVGSPHSQIANSWVSPNGTAYVVARESAYVSVLSQMRIDNVVGTEGKPRRLAARGSGEVFVGGTLPGNTYRWNGFTWFNDQAGASLVVDVGPGGVTYGISPSGGQGFFFYTPGAATPWSLAKAVPAGTALAVLGLNSIWYVSGGIVTYFNGTFSLAPYPMNDRAGNAATMKDVWAADASNVFAVGTGGTIQRWNGASWTAHTPPTTADLIGVWGRAANDVYAWGGTALLHYDGTSWTAVSLPSTLTPLGVWAGSATDLFVITREKGLLRYNGTAWAPVNLGTSIPLFDIIGIGDSIFVSDEIGGVHQVLRPERW